MRTTGEGRSGKEQWEGTNGWGKVGADREDRQRGKARRNKEKVTERWCRQGNKRKAAGQNTGADSGTSVDEDERREERT